MGSPRSVPSLTDDLLEEIFVRIGSPADLARASTACVAFNRLIADPTFLLRYRSLHPPLLLGLIDAEGRGFQPAEAPPPSAALGRAAALAADFSFEDYLPRVTGSRWQVRDVRDGRVLIECLYEEEEDEEVIFFSDLAVCDPLARRYLLLPPIPDALVAPVKMHEYHVEDSEAFLVPSRYEGDGTSFRVLVRMVFTERLVTFIFSSDSGRWSAGTSVSWDALGIQDLEEDCVMVCSSYVYGCFYWKISYQEKWIKLDMSTMEIYAVDLPVGHDVSGIMIVEAGEGWIGLFGRIKGCNSLFYTTTRQIGGESYNQLEVDHVIPLTVGFNHYICGPYEGHIFINGYQPPDKWDDMCFMIEIKTLKLERVCQKKFLYAYPYFGFPPSMSQWRI
ncbi:hypothetical protein BS78_08G145900 [Paspalum vaginatum]|nr:hypothetical protein BS78_08G145900 [Paspalum vaginatum]KAJ1266369.1 hypothetical protein BS78_08G145900 [Paspalum vaginatum]